MYYIGLHVQKQKISYCVKDSSGKIYAEGWIPATPDLHVYGANLVQTLLKHDLVDAFWLKIFPITLGGGKRLFADGTIPAAFKVTESTVTSKGVIIVNYKRAGAVPTGSL